MPSDTSRLIFTYTVQGTNRFADPAALNRALLRASAGTFADIVAAASAPTSPEAEADTSGAEVGADTAEARILSREDAREQLYRIVCASFGLTPFDPATGQGVTEEEAAGILFAFHDWLADPDPDPEATVAVD